MLREKNCCRSNSNVRWCHINSSQSIGITFQGSGGGFSRYIRLIVAESLRLFPQPPLLIRRSLKPDTLPGLHLSTACVSSWYESIYFQVGQSVLSFHVKSPRGDFSNSVTGSFPTGGHQGDPNGYDIPKGVDLFISVRTCLPFKTSSSWFLLDNKCDLVWH